MKPIRKSIVYAAPIDRVWHALTDAETLGRWLMPNDIEPVVGHRFTFRTTPSPGFDGIVSCQVTIANEPTRLAYSWQSGDVDTLVTWELEALDEATTRLTLEHTGFRGFQQVFVRTILTLGWKRKLLPDKLRAVVEGEPLVSRR